MEPPSLFVIVPGFGAPHAETKQRILCQNLATLARAPWSRLDVHVCAYDDSEALHDGDIPAMVSLHWHRAPGIVAEFLRAIATPIAVVPYDYVLILLDDILLDPASIDLADMVRLQRQFGLDIISPTVSRESPVCSPYEYMHSDPDHPYDLKITTCCELFCYLMPTPSYLAYYRYLDPENPWNWGLDLLLYVRLGFKIGMLNRAVVLHHYSERTRNTSLPDPWVGYHHTLRQHGFPEGNQRLADIPSTLYIIRELAPAPVL